jgi:surfeit locus 1 family protein
VWRTALQPRWLGLLAVVLMLCVVFVWLGRWQLDVAENKGHQHHHGVAATAPLDQVVKPQQVFLTGMVGRPVTVSGEYDPGRQVLVAYKRLGDVDGFWVLTALRTSTGALVPVVRGFVPAGSGVTATAAGLAPPTGPVSLSGSLQPPETTPTDAGSLPPGQIPAADTADVVNVWGNPIYNVLVYAASSDPSAAAAAGSTVLQRIPVPAPDSGGGGLALQNTAYAFQWWLFAIFALGFWWRMVRQDTIESAVASGEPEEPDASSDRTKELSTP